jgi:hypothetical protein
MSFKHNKFTIDIVPPPTHFLGASIRVPFSRYISFSDVHQLRPLWKENDKGEQEKITNKLWNALKPNPDIIKELQRLEQLAVATTNRNQDLLQQYFKNIQSLNSQSSKK